MAKKQVARLNRSRVDRIPGSRRGAQGSQHGRRRSGSKLGGHPFSDLFQRSVALGSQFGVAEILHTVPATRLSLPLRRRMEWFDRAGPAPSRDPCPQSARRHSPAPRQPRSRIALARSGSTSNFTPLALRPGRISSRIACGISLTWDYRWWRRQNRCPRSPPAPSADAWCDRDRRHIRRA